MSHKGRNRPPDGSSAFTSLHLSFMFDYQAQPSPRGACGASATVFFFFFYFQNWPRWKTMNYFNDLLSIPRGMQSVETDAQQLRRCRCFRRWMSANKTYELNENTAVARGISLSLLLLLLFCCWATTRTEKVVLLIEKAYNATQYFKRQNTIFLVVRYKLVKNWYVRL